MLFREQLQLTVYLHIGLVILVYKGFGEASADRSVTIIADDESAPYLP